MTNSKQIKKYANMAYRMRKKIIALGYQAENNGAHFAPSLSIVEIMAVLYGKVLNIDPQNPEWEERDRVILSKGHGALGYYPALFEAGIISEEQLSSFEFNGGGFPGQPSKNTQLGIDYSGGTLGMGLSYAAGIALAAKNKNKSFQTYVLLGDGECNEGMVWESAMFAKDQSLSNLIVIIDYNHMQSDGRSKDILDIDLTQLWRGCGWNVIPCDGHDVAALADAFDSIDPAKPNVIMAETVKGKGISFMENNREWHHAKLNEERYTMALHELERKRPGNA